MKKRWVGIVVFAAFLAGGAGNVRADLITLFDNLGKTQSSFDSPTSARYLAQRFMTDVQPYNLNTITLLMKQTSPGVGPTLQLYSDNGLGTSPAGSALMTLTPPGSYTTDFAANVFSGAAYSLAANTSYWAVLSRPSTGVYQWGFTIDDLGGGVGFSPFNAVSTNSGTSWDLQYPADPFQMKVDANTLAGPAVPEPSSFVLLGGIMMGALAYRRRWMKRTV
jgi:hypothetical protein